MNFIIWIPLFGLWFALLFPKSRREKKSFQYEVVLHFVWLLSFVVMGAGILLVSWIVPYFLGNLGEVIFLLYTGFAIIGYLVLMAVGLWMEPIMARWFEKIMLLKKIHHSLFLG